VYLKYFEDVRGFLRYKQMWLSHCPIHPQELYRCKLNVHGHIHKNTNSPELPLPYVNVNWDFWKRAISLDELRELV
jgi:calcineurin-like phosphoesterase family protein